MLFVTDDPENHKLIRVKEVEYIVTQRKIPTSCFAKRRPPYLKILLNRTVWTLAFCDFASTFGLYMVVIEGPSFISNVLNKNILEVVTECLFSDVMFTNNFKLLELSKPSHIKLIYTLLQNGVLNALPQLAIFIYGLIFSSLSDILMVKGYVTKTKLRCCMTMISLGLPGITVAILGYTTNSYLLCMSVLSIGIGFRAAIYIGHIGTVYDIAPSYSGTVYGFVSTIGNLSGFITPLLASALIKHDPHDVRGWRNLFWLSSGFYLAAALAFPLLVSQGPASFETENAEGYQLIGNEDFAIDAKKN